MMVVLRSDSSLINLRLAGLSLPGIVLISFTVLVTSMQSNQGAASGRYSSSKLLLIRLLVV